MSELGNNLDATIAAAVQAQISAQVMEALSGQEFFARYISSVLQQKVEIPDPNGGYGKIKVAYVDNAIRQVMQKAVAEAVKLAVEEERDHIQDEVRKAVKRRSAEFAVAMTDKLLESAEDNWRFNIQMYAPRRES